MSSQRTLIHGLILGAFCLGFGTLLVMTNGYTKDDIAMRALEDRQNSLAQVIPESIHDNNLATDTLVLKNDQGNEVTIYVATKEGKVTGVAFETSSPGYSGAIKVMLGVDPEGKIIGARVLAHKETPGLGDKIEVKKGDWILRFTGLSIGNPPLDKWKVKKDGGIFDQFAGATITPRAVVKAITEGLQFFDANKAKLMEFKAADAETGKAPAKGETK
ncbi:electron transport complex subunit RsxG [Candidatus Ferrigenium straubiae]|jgi:electron transport complex protein RnfG|uniref:electron transport complex subunit RsxG n=1 Tax=Candidatus Ferrigenium straubiae TaxID=2919506 RepID=UPI003F4AE7A8